MKELKEYLAEKQKDKISNTFINESIGTFSFLLKNGKIIKIELIKDKVNGEILSALKK